MVFNLQARYPFPFQPVARPLGSTQGPATCCLAKSGAKQCRVAQHQAALHK
jgi:hypothetical protein